MFYYPLDFFMEGEIGVGWLDRLWHGDRTFGVAEVWEGGSHELQVHWLGRSS